MRQGTGIFISYRRSDAAGHAGRLFDWLRAQRRTRKVFIDVAGIKLGGDFAQAIDAALRGCGCMLVVIGREWAASLQAQRGDAEDWVRIEIERGLQAGLRVIPVLVGGAVLPTPGQLPASLLPLLRLQAIELSDSKWESDRELLLRVISPQILATRTMVLATTLTVAIGALVVAAVSQVQDPRRTRVPVRPAWNELDPVRLAQLHGDSPLVVRSLLTLLHENGVPDAALLPRLEASTGLLRDIDHTIVFNRRDYVRDRQARGGAFKDGEAQRKVIDEFDKTWHAVGRLLNEGRFAEASSTLAIATDQRVGQRSPAALGIALADEAALAYWLVGQIERLALSPARAVERYELATRFIVVSEPAGRSRLTFPLLSSWAALLTEQGDHAGAAAKYREALQLAERQADGPEQVSALRGLGSSLEAQRRFADAAPVRARALELQLRSSDAGQPFTQDRAREYAATLTRLGRDGEARALLERFGLAAAKP